MASAIHDIHNDGTGEGVNFRVVDVDTFRFNEVVGRCFCPASVMQQAMESNTPIVMSLGEGCAYSISAADRLHCCHCVDPCMILL